MKKFLLFFIACIISALTLSAQEFLKEDYYDFRQAAFGLTYEGLADMYSRPAPWYYKGFTNGPDFKSIHYLDSVILKLELTGEELDLLEQNLFFVTERLSFSNFGHAFHTIYNYDNMPNHLFWNATESEYADVATLFRDVQVAMEDVYGSGTDLLNMSYALSNYFNYKESDIAYMHDYTPAEWTQLLKNEIDNGRSLVIQAMNLDYFGDWHSNNNIGGHWYHCDGYNEEGEFHIVVGFGDYQYDGYYSIEEFPIFSYNVGILTGLEPDLNGKNLSVTKPNGDFQIHGIRYDQNPGQRIQYQQSENRIYHG